MYCGSSSSCSDYLIKFQLLVSNPVLLMHLPASSVPRLENPRAHFGVWMISLAREEDGVMVGSRCKHNDGRPYSTGMVKRGGLERESG